MKLDIVVPTYNRADLLKRTLESLANARLPLDFEVVVTVVDNNSTDNTREAVENLRPQFTKIKLEYVFESRQGKSYALNTGIERADGELLSGVDDDVAVAENWYIELEKVFRERWNEIDFVGGKILPEWENELIPAWIEPLKDGVISWRDYGDEEWEYGENTPILTGAHCVLKREIFDQIGLLVHGIGPVGKNLMVCDDDIVYDKLLSAEKKGRYIPQLVVYHFVPQFRVSKSYYRQWCFAAGVSKHLMDAHYKPLKETKLFGVPRWMYRTALSGVFSKIKNIIRRNETESLAAENQPAIFAGYFYGRNLQNSWLDKPLQAFAGKFFNSAQR